jgi:hypothetical protein
MGDFSLSMTLFISCGQVAILAFRGRIAAS